MRVARIEYHSKRARAALRWVKVRLSDGAFAMAQDLAVYHARMAARSALNRAHNGRRPK